MPFSSKDNSPLDPTVIYLANSGNFSIISNTLLFTLSKALYHSSVPSVHSDNVVFKLSYSSKDVFKSSAAVFTFSKDSLASSASFYNLSVFSA
jgi:hypothetical protein